MNLIDRGLEQAFELGRDGRVVFRAFGMMSRGRLIKGRQTFDNVRSKYIWISLFMTFGVAAIAVANRIAITFEQALTAVGLHLAVCWLLYFLLANSLPYEDEDMEARLARGGSIVGPAVLAYLSLMGALVGGFLIAMGGEEYRETGFACFAVFGLLLAFFLRMILMRRRSNGANAAAER